MILTHWGILSFGACQRTGLTAIIERILLFFIDFHSAYNIRVYSKGLINVAIKGISKKERDEYYNFLEKSDPCFNQIHRLIEKHKKFTPTDVDKTIKIE
jgi:hypothetical protein